MYAALNGIVRTLVPLPQVSKTVKSAERNLSAGVKR